MNASRFLAAPLLVFACSLAGAGCSSSNKQDPNQPAKVECRSCHQVVVAAAHCSSCGADLSSSLPPGSPPSSSSQPPRATRARGNYVVTLQKLGKTNADYLVATLKANADFQDWNATGTYRYELNYTGGSIEKAIKDAAESSGVRVYVNVNGRNVEVQNSQGE